MQEHDADLARIIVRVLSRSIYGSLFASHYFDKTLENGKTLAEAKVTATNYPLMLG
jgi:hypothetical protein